MEKNPETCPGLRDLIQPKPAYINCHVCGAELEIWSRRQNHCPIGAKGNAPSKTGLPALLQYAVNVEAYRSKKN
jgi:hypothetical protein